MIARSRRRAYEIMGADVKQTGEAVRQVGEVPALAGPRGEPEVLRRRARSSSRKEAADLLLEIGIIKQMPDIDALVDTRFIQ